MFRRIREMTREEFCAEMRLTACALASLDYRQRHPHCPEADAVSFALLSWRCFVEAATDFLATREVLLGDLQAARWN